MAQGTFYHYYKNKMGLFEELLQDFVDLLIGELHSFDYDCIVDADLYLLTGHQMGERIVKTFLENRELAHIFLRDAVGIDQNLSLIIGKGYSDIIKFAIKHLEYGVKFKVIGKEFSIKAIAMSMVGSLFFMINRYLLGEIRELSIETILEYSLKMHLYGIVIKK